jgi:hypothetical protein
MGYEKNDLGVQEISMVVDRPRGIIAPQLLMAIVDYGFPLLDAVFKALDDVDRYMPLPPSALPENSKLTGEFMMKIHVVVDDH